MEDDSCVVRTTLHTERSGNSAATGPPIPTYAEQRPVIAWQRSLGAGGRMRGVSAETNTIIGSRRAKTDRHAEAREETTANAAIGSAKKKDRLFTDLTRQRRSTVPSSCFSRTSISQPSPPSPRVFVGPFLRTGCSSIYFVLHFTHPPVVADPPRSPVSFEGQCPTPGTATYHLSLLASPLSLFLLVLLPLPGSFLGLLLVFGALNSSATTKSLMQGTTWT